MPGGHKDLERKRASLKAKLENVYFHKEHKHSSSFVGKVIVFSLLLSKKYKITRYGEKAQTKRISMFQMAGIIGLKVME